MCVKEKGAYDVIRGTKEALGDTSILHHAFILIFIAFGLLLHLISQYLCLLSPLFYNVYMKRENAGGGNSGLEKEQILETYYAQLQKS